MSTIGESSEFDCDLSASTTQLNSTESYKPTKVNVKSSRSVDKIWNDKKTYKSDDSYSEVSDCDNFLAKGAFLLTPSHEVLR